MKKLQDEGPLLKQVLTLIESHFGNHCEVVLHDLTNEYNHTIIDIRNGHITNRKIGGCGSNLGLEVLNGSVVEGDRYNYVTTTQDGRILRSSSIYLRDEDGQVIGSICINLDITESTQFEGFLRNYNHFETGQTEYFAQDVSNLLDYLVKQAQRLVNKNPQEMTKEDRHTFLSFLDQKGAFLVSKSGAKICEYLDISKFTLYNDLDAIREKRKNNL